MAITFIEKTKKSKYLIWVLAVVILLLVVILWRGVFTKQASVYIPPVETPAKKIVINFKALENPVLEKLQLLEEIPRFEGEVGRENPFILYTAEEKEEKKQEIKEETKEEVKVEMHQEIEQEESLR